MTVDLSWPPSLGLETSECAGPDLNYLKREESNAAVAAALSAPAGLLPPFNLIIPHWILDGRWP